MCGTRVCPVWINKNAINWLDLVFYIVRAAATHVYPALWIAHCCLLCKNAPQWAVHRGSLHQPVGKVQTLWVLPGTLLDSPPTLDPTILSFAIHTAHHPVPSVTKKTMYLKNVSTWQIEPTHAIYVKLIKWNKKFKTSAQIFIKPVVVLQLLFPSSKCFCKSS